MRVIVYGAGAVGSLIGVRLFEQGHDVTLIARGANYRALNSDGVRLETPGGTATVKIPVVEDPSALEFQPSDVVILSMKSQDTTEALRRLAFQCHPSTSIVCAQNGVENERVALRLFENVYGMYVMCQAIQVTPGIVKIPTTPISAILDLGRWPVGTDKLTSDLVGALNGATFDSIARDDIARWKWGKLLRNLGNVVEAICGFETRGGELSRRATQEGIDVLHAAGIEFVSGSENVARREGILEIAGPEFGGGSSWQSLVRRTGSVETDYLTGEIVLQGRLFGVPTPVSELLQRLANEMARERLAPGRWGESEILNLL
jgi:2-dehydropantoate 2-reductase